VRFWLFWLADGLLIPAKKRKVARKKQKSEELAGADEKPRWGKPRRLAFCLLATCSPNELTADGPRFEDLRSLDA
jgi:hypothetical protein